MSDNPQGVVAARGADLLKIHDRLYAIEKQLRATIAAVSGGTAEVQPKSELNLAQAMMTMSYAFEQIDRMLTRVEDQANRLHVPR